MSFGTVFELTPSKSGWTEIVLYFAGQSDGGFRYFGVILDAAGSLYGTTYVGGSAPDGNGNGVVFQLKP